eukprot:8960247-Pyramimonas_sp.AAC.1
MSAFLDDAPEGSESARTQKQEKEGDTDDRAGRDKAFTSCAAQADAAEKASSVSAMKERKVASKLMDYFKKGPSDVIIKYIVDLIKGFLFDPPR